MPKTKKRKVEAVKPSKLAEAIARDLFTSGVTGEVAARLRLMHPAGDNLDIGGWCEHAVACRIEWHLKQSRYQ